MSKLQKNFKETLRDALTQLLWKQWSTLGIASFVEPQKTWVIDPEALMVATTFWQNEDLRLYEVARVWIFKHRDYWMQTRYKKIIKYCIEMEKGLLRKSNLINFLQYKLSLQDPQHIHERRREILKPLLTKNPPLIRLKLRGIFGREARSEVFLYYLYHREGTSLSIAKETFLEQKSVYSVAKKWQETGMLERRIGKKTGYVMPDRVKKAWLNALEIKTLPQYLNWGRVFTGLCLIMEALSIEPWGNDSYLRSSFYRDILPLFAELREKLRISFPEPTLYPGEAFTSVFEDFVVSAMNKLESLE